jgi:hypothetical protein
MMSWTAKLICVYIAGGFVFHRLMTGSLPIWLPNSFPSS